jgi:effector-binding domain-containing protein
MIDEPHITQSETQMIAFIHVTVPREEIRFVMDPALRELKGALAGQGIKPIGPWFTHHLRIDPKVFDFQVCLPVSKEVVATGRVQAGRMFETKVARTIYRGPYEGLGDAWREFGKWIEAHGFRPGEDLWECYLAGPEKSNNPAEWETKLSRAIE